LECLDSKGFSGMVKNISLKMNSILLLRD